MITNAVGGSIEQVSWDQLIELAPKVSRADLCDIASAETVHGVVAFQVLDMSSSQHGRRSFMIYGPFCTFKTIEEATQHRLGDVPSRFAYPTHYWSRA